MGRHPFPSRPRSGHRMGHRTKNVSPRKPLGHSVAGSRSTCRFPRPPDAFAHLGTPRVWAPGLSPDPRSVGAAGAFDSVQNPPPTPTPPGPSRGREFSIGYAGFWLLLCGSQTCPWNHPSFPLGLACTGPVWLVFSGTRIAVWSGTITKTKPNVIRAPSCHPIPRTGLRARRSAAALLGLFSKASEQGTKMLRLLPKPNSHCGVWWCLMSPVRQV